MTELKTLKDFETEEIFGKVEGDKDGMVIAPFEYISKKELKEEAVKWAKKYYKENDTWNWDFLEFFNLAEEDLK